MNMRWRIMLSLTALRTQSASSFIACAHGHTHTLTLCLTLSDIKACVTGLGEQINYVNAVMNGLPAYTLPLCHTHTHTHSLWVMRFRLTWWGILHSECQFYPHKQISCVFMSFCTSDSRCPVMHSCRSVWDMFFLFFIVYTLALF